MQNDPKPNKVKTGEEYTKMLKEVAERVSKWPYWMIGEESRRPGHIRYKKKNEENPTTEPVR